jgi:hypothetical protein
MKPNHKQIASLLSVAIIVLTFAIAPHARANVYATNIKLNGSFLGVTNNNAVPVTISYILNERATLGTTIKILSGATVVDTITIPSGSAGSLLGSNSVVWGGTNSGGSAVGSGIYSVSITPAASGYTNWTQISKDSSNTVAVFPHGMAVDDNTNSPYYGRVVVGCSIQGTANGVSQKCGLYKANADGSPADEGAFGYAGYTTNDGGGTDVGQMSSGTASPYGNYYVNPSIIRIGEDDRIYWADDSYCGAIVACDILAATNQLVITSGPGGPYGPSPANPTSPHNYGNNPQADLLDQNGYGIQQFDVVNAGKTNAAIYLADFGDSPNWGVWMYHLTNGASDTNDTMGTQAVTCMGSNLIVTGSGLMLDYNQDIFISQNRFYGNDTNQRVWLYTNWNGGTLPADNGDTNYAEGFGIPPAEWAVGAGDTNMTAIYDTVLNSRVNPTMIAIAMVAGDEVAGGYDSANGGIRILSALDGSTVVSNLDIANWYNAVAFDNVGNVYGASRSANYWRVWSPPGTNQATTVAVPTILFGTLTSPPITITSITVNGSTVTVNFTGSSSASASSFTLYSSTTVNGAYSPVAGAVVSLVSPGVFKATTTTSGSSQFYRIYGP